MNQIFMVEAATGNVCLTVEGDFFEFEDTSFKKISDEGFVLEKNNQKNVIYLNEIFKIDCKGFFFCKKDHISLLEQHPAYILKTSAKKFFHFNKDILYFALDLARSKFFVFYLALTLTSFIYIQHLSSTRTLDFDLVKSQDVFVKKNLYVFFNDYSKSFVDMESPTLEGQKDPLWQIIYGSPEEAAPEVVVPEKPKPKAVKPKATPKQSKFDADVQMFLNLKKGAAQDAKK